MFEVVAVEELLADESFDSVNFSNVSLANDTVAFAEDRTLLVLLETGVCRFVNQPAAAVAAAIETHFDSFSVCGFTPLIIETSKLLDLFDFFKLDRRSGGFNELPADLLFVVSVVDELGDCMSFILFISVADEANEESKDIKSVLVQTIPDFFEGVTLGEVSMLGFSEARRCDDACGIGVRVVDMKSENLLLEYR